MIVSGGARFERLLKIGKWLAPFVGVLIFSIAFYFITKFLRQHSIEEIRDSFKNILPAKIAVACALTLLSYFVLSLYDILGFRFVGIRLARSTIMLGAFIAFALNNSIGLANLAGTAVRMRFYSHLGVGAGKVLQVVAFVSISFWLGFVALAGLVFLFFGVSLPATFTVSPVVFQALGFGFLFLVALYLVHAAKSRGFYHFGKFQLKIPGFSVSLAQIAIAMVDWTLAASVLYVLLPDSVDLSLAHFLSVFMAAQVLALVAHVPGGLGVLESVVLYLVVPDHHAAPAVVAALIAYRLIYYFVPLGVASLALFALELRHRVWR